MMTNTQIRAFARGQLRGHWGTIIAAELLRLLLMTLYIILVYAAVLFSVFSPLMGVTNRWFLHTYPELWLVILALAGMVFALLLGLGLVLYVGLTLGNQRMYLALARGQHVVVADLFKGFSSIAHMKHFFGTMLCITLLELVLELPLLLRSLGFADALYGVQNLELLTSLLVYLLGLYLSIASLASADHPRMKAGRALQAAWRTLHGRKLPLLSLCLSFLGWFLLSAVTFGLATIWVRPYFREALSIFYLSAYSAEYQSNVEDAEYRELTPEETTPEPLPEKKKPSRSFDEVRQEYTYPSEEAADAPHASEGEHDEVPFL